MKKRISILALVFMPFLATAVEPVWFKSKIKKLYPLADGSIVVIFEDSSPSCTNTSKYHHLSSGSNGMTEQGLERVYSALLVAASAKKVVNVNFDASSSLCHINRVLIDFSS